MAEENNNIEERSDNSPDAETLPVGFIFGNYKILGSIGQGGIARVYRARNLQSGTEVAIKVMNQALVNRPESRQRFVREGMIASTIRHPNVVNVYEVGSWKSFLFIVMELLTGIDLEHYIKEVGLLSHAEVVALALPVVAGVAAVHRAGLVHRALKPSNIFLAAGKGGFVEPQLLDVGISNLHADSKGSHGGPTGSCERFTTPAYFSPEALNGTQTLGPQSDQYSLGVVLFECLVGYTPFVDLSLLQRLRALASGEVPSPRSHQANVTPGMDALVRRAMDTSPGRRFKDAADLGQALWQLSEEPLRALWAPQFADAEYTAPLLGSTATANGLVHHGLILRQSALLPALLPAVPPAVPPSIMERFWARWRPLVLGASALLTLSVGLLVALSQFQAVPVGPTTFSTSTSAAKPIAARLLAAAAAVSPNAVPLPMVSLPTDPLAGGFLSTGSTVNTSPDSESFTRTDADARSTPPRAESPKPTRKRSGAVKPRTAKRHAITRRSAKSRKGRRTTKVAALLAPKQGLAASREGRSDMTQDDELSKMFGLQKELSASPFESSKRDKKSRAANGAPILD